jgi:ElaB/YqjD/DUF883 family membrane-anchored ribosome-binding protein
MTESSDKVLNEDSPVTDQRTLEAAAEEARRVIDEVRAMLDCAGVHDLDSQARAAMERLHASQEALSRTTQQVSRSLHDLGGAVERELEAAESQVRSHPLLSLVAAGAVGLLVGLALSRRRR